METGNLSPRLHQILLKIESAADVQTALYIFQEAYDVDFVTYHLAQTVADVVDAPFVRTTYAEAWVARYLLRGYVKIDPVVKQGFLRQMPFDWQEVDVPPNAHDFLLDAHQHGLGANGFSIPIVDRSRLALFSVNSRMENRDWAHMVADQRAEWLEIPHVIHRKAIFELHGQHDPVPQLSLRELECLQWSALGKDSKDIAAILRLSEYTIQGYIKTLRHKLGGGPITSVVARGIQLRLINPHVNTPS